MAGTCGPFRSGGHRPPPLSPPCCRRREPCVRRFTEQIALKLTKGAENVKDEPPGGGRVVDVLGQRPEPHAAIFQVGDGLKQMRYRPAQAVEFSQPSRPKPTQEAPIMSTAVNSAT